jgi:hypothetical protein
MAKAKRAKRIVKSIALRDNDPMPFGKHKGTSMKNVPADYLDWLRGQDWIAKWPMVAAYLDSNKSVIDAELADCRRDEEEEDLDYPFDGYDFSDHYH